MNMHEGRAPISAQDLQSIYTKPLTCKICQCEFWRPTVRMLYNPIAGPKGGLVPRDGLITCAQCGAPLGAEPPSAEQQQQLTLDSSQPVASSN